MIIQSHNLDSWEILNLTRQVDSQYKIRKQCGFYWTGGTIFRCLPPAFLTWPDVNSSSAVNSSSYFWIESMIISFSWQFQAWSSGQDDAQKKMKFQDVIYICDHVHNLISSLNEFKHCTPIRKTMPSNPTISIFCSSWAWLPAYFSFWEICCPSVPINLPIYYI